MIDVAPIADGLPRRCCDVRTRSLGARPRSFGARPPSYDLVPRSYDVRPRSYEVPGRGDEVRPRRDVLVAVVDGVARDGEEVVRCRDVRHGLTEVQRDAFAVLAIARDFVAAPHGVVA